MKNRFVYILFFFASVAAKADEQYDANCRYLKSIVRLNQTISSESDDNSIVKQMRQAYRALCKFTYSNNATVNYPNGQMATISYGNGGYNWYYANGKSITSGSSYSTWYYPNGSQIASSKEAGYTVTYPNGKVATSSWMKSNATWYYPNGQTITVSAGGKGFSWYYPNGKTISSSMGSLGATWYKMDGTIFTNNGPELSESELINVPSILSYVLFDDLDE